MADLTGLDLQEPERLEGDYTEAGAIPNPPPAGRYLCQVPETFEFGTSKAKALKVQIDPLVIADGEHKGYRIRFTSASFKRFKRGNGMASQVEDYLRANGIATIPQSNAEAAQLIESTAGRVIPVDLDWEAYDKESQETVAKSYDEFPSDGNGGRLPYVENANGKRLRANARVRRFISTVS